MTGASARNLMIGAGAASAAMLAFAIAAQAVGYAPCDLCILQRWPHLAAAIIGGIVLFGHGRRIWAALGALSLALATAFAVFHTGVEAGWWPGPSACSGMAGIAQLSTEELMAQIQTAPLVRCDEVSWSFLGLSMAAWNGILSACLLVVWMMAWRRSHR